MDLAEIYRVMRRRWYVIVPGVLVTLALTVGVYLVVPTKYQSQSTVQLLNSEKGSKDTGDNPFLATSMSLTAMADTLSRTLGSDSSKADLKVKGVSDPYVVMIADNASAPLLWITVTGTDPAKVLADDALITSYAKDRLAQLQLELRTPTNALIRMTTIVEPQTPVAQTKTKIEYLALVGIMGVVGSMFATFFVEARRRPKPTVRPPGDDLDGDGLDGDLDDEADDESGESDERVESPAVSASASAPSPRRRPNGDELLNESTMQLSVLKLPEAAEAAESEDRAIWFT